MPKTGRFQSSSKSVSQAELFSTRHFSTGFQMRAVLPFLVTLCAAQPALSEESLPATRMAQIFFTQCVDPLAAEAQPETSDLVQFSREEAVKHRPTSDGRFWSAEDADVLLTWLHTKSREFEGCVVERNSIAPRGTSIDGGSVVSAFDEWADQALKSGRYSEINRCWEGPGTYFRTLESTFERTYPIRVGVHWKEQIDFIFLLAGETGTNDKAPCNEPPVM